VLFHSLLFRAELFRTTLFSTLRSIDAVVARSLSAFCAHPLLAFISIQLHSADVHLICLHIGLGITADEYLLYCPEENVVL